MGVNFFSCHHCGDSVCDCGPYKRCRESCGIRWCSLDCAQAAGYRLDDEELQESSCNFCRLEDVENTKLLHFVLALQNLSLAEAKRQYLVWAKQREQ